MYDTCLSALGHHVTYFESPGRLEIPVLTETLITPKDRARHEATGRDLDLAQMPMPPPEQGQCVRECRLTIYGRFQ